MLLLKMMNYFNFFEINKPISKFLYSFAVL